MAEPTPSDPKSPGLDRVLVVDDDTAVRGLVQIALGDLGGLSVLACGSGAEARSRVPAFQPDLMVLDMQLPDIDGPGLAAWVRALPGLEDTPSVLLTGRPEAVQRLVDPDGAVVAVLGKPFDPIGLADALRAIWAVHRERCLDRRGRA